MKDNRSLTHCRHSSVGVCELCKLEAERFQEIDQMNARHLQQKQTEGLRVSAEPEAIAEIRLTGILLFSHYEFFGLGSDRSLIKGKGNIIDLSQTNAIFLDAADPNHAMIRLVQTEEKGTSVRILSRGSSGITVDGEFFAPPWTDNLMDGESLQIGENHFRFKTTASRNQGRFPGRVWLASLQVCEMINPPILQLEGKGNEIFQKGGKRGLFPDEITLGHSKWPGDPKPDWMLPSPLVSWNHASFFFKDEVFYIRNGWFGQPCKHPTYVTIREEQPDDRPMTPERDEARLLRDGQEMPLGKSAEILIGPFLFNFRRVESIKEQVARLAKSYQFQPAQQERLSELLYKNREGLIQPQEEEELDALIEELDRRKLLLADDIQKLAHQQ